MQKIPLMRAKAGMVLARPVYRGDAPTGIPVCGKDTELTDALITRLGQMDIQSLYVEGHPVWEEGERSFDDLLRDLDGRFEKSRNEPLNELLYRIYRAQASRSMGGDSDPAAQ